MKQWLEDRIIKYPNGCWSVGKKTKGNPRTLVINGKSYQAHRLAYQVFQGPVPEGLFVVAVCGNRWCVRHLELMTPEVQKKFNILRKIKHGYKPSAVAKWMDANGITSREIANASDMSYSTISLMRQTGSVGKETERKLREIYKDFPKL